MDELIFEVTQEADGCFVAECLAEPIFTQADTWDELRVQVQDAVTGYCFDKAKPKDLRPRLHLVRDMDGIGSYWSFYNTEKPHWSLGKRTPAEVSFGNTTGQESTLN